jgi:hypothetical protein
MFAGVDGEHILAARNNMSSAGYIPEYFIGIATQDLAQNGFGYITVFGKINGLNTLAYTAGDLLYADPAVIGGLTKVEPQAPNLHIIVAAVTKRAGGDGHILVRPTFRPKLSNLSDVQITNIANNNLIKYNSANSRFENVSASSVIEPAYAQANSALSIAQSAFAQANTGGAAGTDNLARSIANSAFSTANSALSIAQSAFAQANTGGGGVAESLNVQFSNSTGATYKVVALDSTANTVLASASDITQVDKILGVLDSSGETVTFGSITNVSWTWTPEQSLYLGSNGDVVTTSTINGAAFSLKLGYAISATKAFIKIGTPIVL